MKISILNQVNFDAFDLLKPTVVNCGSALSIAVYVQRPADGFTITGCKVRVTNADGTPLTIGATLVGSDYVATFPASHFERYGRVENGVAISVLGADESGVERVWIERMGSLYIRPTDAQSEAGDPGLEAKYLFTSPTFAQTDSWIFTGNTTSFTDLHLVYTPASGEDVQSWILYDGSVVLAALYGNDAPEDATTLIFTAVGITATRVYSCTIAPFANSQADMGLWEFAGDIVPGSNYIVEEVSVGNGDYAYTLYADGTQLDTTGGVHGKQYKINFTSADIVATRPPQTLTVAVSESDVLGAMRDLWFVIKAGDDDAPTITWPANFVPANDDADNLVAEANATTVFLISEYSPDKFIVARQVVEAAS